MPQQYPLSIAAARAGTKSRFAFAEALAVEIPKNAKDVPGRLEAIRDAVLGAGLDCPSVNTMDFHRKVALWVATGSVANPEFRWVKGASFTAHREAYGVGLTYRRFASLDPEQRTQTELRKLGGARQPHATVAQVNVRSLPPERKAEMYRDLARDPEVLRHESARRKREYAETNPEAVTNPADLKAIQAHTRDALAPMMESLANLKVVSAIERAAKELRACNPDADLLADIDRALDDLAMARREIEFRVGAA